MSKNQHQFQRSQHHPDRSQDMRGSSNPAGETMHADRRGPPQHHLKQGSRSHNYDPRQSNVSENQPTQMIEKMYTQQYQHYPGQSHQQSQPGADEQHQMGKRSGGLGSHRKQLQSKRYPTAKYHEQQYGGPQTQYQMKDYPDHCEQVKHKAPQQQPKFGPEAADEDHTINEVEMEQKERNRSEIEAKIAALQNQLKQYDAPAGSSPGNTDGTNRQSPSTAMTDRQQPRNDNAKKFSPSLRSKESKKGKFPSPSHQQKMSPKQTQSEMQKHDGEQLVHSGSGTRLLQSPPIKVGGHQHLDKIRVRTGSNTQAQNNESSGNQSMDNKYHNPIGGRNLAGAEELDMQPAHYKEGRRQIPAVPPEQQNRDRNEDCGPPSHMRQNQRQHIQRHQEKARPTAPENTDMVDDYSKMRHDQLGHNPDDNEPESPQFKAAMPYTMAESPAEHDELERHIPMPGQQFLRDSRHSSIRKHPRDGQEYLIQSKQMPSRVASQFEDGMDNNQRHIKGHIMQDDPVDELTPPQSQMNYRRKPREPPSSIFRASGQGQSQKYSSGGRHGPHLDGVRMRGELAEYKEDFEAHNQELDLQHEDLPQEDYEATHGDAALDCIPAEEGTHDPQYLIRNPQSQSDNTGELTLNEEGTHQQPDLNDEYSACGMPVDVMEQAEEINYDPNESEVHVENRKGYHIADDQEASGALSQEELRRGPPGIGGTYPKRLYHKGPPENQHSYDDMEEEDQDQEDILQEEPRDVFQEEQEDAEDGYDDGQSAVHSQYYQDKNDYTTQSQMHYDQGDQEDEGFIDDEMIGDNQGAAMQQARRGRDEDSEYSNERTQDIIRDENGSQGSQVLEEHDAHLDGYCDDEGPSSGIGPGGFANQGLDRPASAPEEYQDEVQEHHDHLDHDQVDAYDDGMHQEYDQGDQEHHVDDDHYINDAEDLIDHKRGRGLMRRASMDEDGQHHHEQQYMDEDQEGMAIEEQNDNYSQIDQKQKQLSRLGEEIQEEPMTFRHEDGAANQITHNDEIEDEVHDPYAENEEQLEQHADELPIAENVTSFQILRILQHRLVCPPAGSAAAEQDLEFLCMLDLVCDMDEENNYPQVRKITSWLSIQRILDSDGSLNSVHLRMYCEGKNLTFDGINEIECGVGDVQGREDHSNSRYTNEEFDEENSHYTAEQESNIPSSVDINTTQAGTVGGQAISGVTVNTVSNFSGTTSAVASASAAPSTIRDMTLPPLSDHQSDITRQHDVSISANMQAYGTEGPSNENTLQYDTKNPFSTAGMNRSVQGNCTDEARSSSMQSKGIDAFTTNGRDGGRSVDRYRDRPTMKAFQEQIIKESSLNTNELDNKQRRDSDEFIIENSGIRRKHDSPKSETKSSHGDDDLIDHRKNYIGRKRGSTRKICDDDDNFTSISDPAIKLTRHHGRKQSLREKQQDRHLNSDEDNKALDHHGNHSENNAEVPEIQKNSQQHDRYHKRGAALDESANCDRDSEPDHKYVRQTRSGRQSKKPANFDQYSAASQNPENRKVGDYEEEKEEYFGNYRNQSRPPKKVNYRYGQHHEQQNSERAYNRKKIEKGGKDQDHKIDNLSNRSSESEYLTNEIQRRPRQDKKDEVLGFISSSHQTESKKEGKNEAGLGDMVLTRRGLKKGLEIDPINTNSGYYTTTPEPNKGNVRAGRKRSRHTDLIEDDKSEEQSEQEEEDEYQHFTKPGQRNKRKTWLDKINEGGQTSKPSGKDEGRDEFKKRMAKQQRKKKQIGQRIMQQKIVGSFEQNHQPNRIRSIRNTTQEDIKALVANMRKERSERLKQEYEEDMTNQSGVGMYGDENGITNSVFKYPFSAILCTVEWQDQYNENKKTKIEDSKVSYETVREKDPKLLCDFFERHLQFANQ